MKSHEDLLKYRTGEFLPYKEYLCRCCKMYVPILESYRIDMPGFIYDGIAVRIESGWKYGVDEQYLK